MSEETQKTPETETPTPEEAETEPQAEAPEDEPAEEAEPEAEEAAAEDASEEPAPEEEASAEAEEAALAADSLRTYEELEAEAADLKDKLLRALAETENVRRRAARDRQDAAKYGIAGFAREMLGVADNLRRALDHVDAETREANEAINSLASGVEMTERAMLTAFERFGVKPIEALGNRFDHNLHEAMFELEDPSQPAGTVVQELEKGYVLEDRLLRPARVGVSKGGPAANGDVKAEAADDGPSAKGSRTAYEKQSDAQTDARGGKGGQFDEKL